MREIRTSGSVRGEEGNLLTYSTREACMDDNCFWDKGLCEEGRITPSAKQTVRQGTLMPFRRFESCPAQVTRPAAIVVGLSGGNEWCEALRIGDGWPQRKWSLPHLGAAERLLGRLSASASADCPSLVLVPQENAISEEFRDLFGLYCAYSLGYSQVFEKWNPGRFDVWP